MSKGSKESGRDQLDFAGQDDSWSQQQANYSWRMQQRKANAWRPPTDVYETEAAFIVLVEIAGMRGTDFSVTLDKGELIIGGARVERGGPKAYHQMEISYGEFQAEIRLPAKVEAEAIEATYGDGFLRVVLPKLQPTRISVDP